MSHLLLLDMDGTLLTVNPKAEKTNPKRKIFPRVLHDVFGVGAPPYDVLLKENLAGMTDVMIIRHVLRAMGLDDGRIDEGLPRVEKMICDFARDVTEFGKRNDSYIPLPGVAKALDTFREAGFAMAVCTGNLECLARMKLHIAGIDTTGFGPGGYGSDAEERSDIIAAAIARNPGYDPERIIYFGDTPRDVLAARDAGVLCVAVTVTREFTAEGLAGAAAILETWSDLDPVFELLDS